MTRQTVQNLVPTVLVVEDYADLRAAVVSSLVRAHYVCDDVGNSADAVEKLRDHHYNAILLAPRLPIADDPVMQYLRAEQPDEVGKVILMTDPEVRGGDCRTLVKPFNQQELIDKLTNKH